MNIIQAIILGIIQGITEFLPVSSSGHLVVIPYLFGWQLEEKYVFAFSVLVQVGTLLSIIVYYRKDLISIGQSIYKGIQNKNLLKHEEARVGIFAFAATIPAAIMGLIMKEQIESFFNNPEITPYFLIGTSLLLIIAEFAGRKDRKIENLGFYDALWIGIFQVLSLFPGLSRSGSTIAGGVTRNFTRKTSGQFSFLMAIPILAAAGAVGLVELLQVPDLVSFLPVMSTGMISSGVVGYFSIRWLLSYLNGRSLLPFAGYCLMLASITLLFFHANPLANINFPIFNQNSEDDVYLASYDSELEWLVPEMNTCGEKIPGGGLLLQQSAWVNTIMENRNIHLCFGEVDAEGSQIYILGYDQIVPVAAGDHPVDTIPNNVLKDIFSGKVSSWGEVYGGCETCFLSEPENPDNPVTVWMYTENSQIRKEIEENYLNGTNISTYASLAPNSDFIRQSISTNSESIGFIPRGWIDSSIKEITIKNFEMEAGLPILAISRDELNGDLQAWLTCLKDSIGVSSP